MVRLLHIDPMVSGSNPPSAAAFAYSEESCKLSAIPGIGIMRLGHIEREGHQRCSISNQLLSVQMSSYGILLNKKSMRAIYE